MADKNAMPGDAPLNDLAARLAAWSPAPPVDAARRDRLLFEAGAQAGRRRGRQQAGALGLILLVGLGSWGLRERQTRTGLEVALRAERTRADGLARLAPPPRPVVAPPPLPRAEPLGPSSVLALSRQFARGDLARLDPPPPPAADEAPAAPILTPRSRPGSVDPPIL